MSITNLLKEVEIVIVLREKLYEFLFRMLKI